MTKKHDWVADKLCNVQLWLNVDVWSSHVGLGAFQVEIPTFWWWSQLRTLSSNRMHTKMRYWFSRNMWINEWMSDSTFNWYQHERFLWPNPQKRSFGCRYKKPFYVKWTSCHLSYPITLIRRSGACCWWAPQVHTISCISAIWQGCIAHFTASLAHL